MTTHPEVPTSIRFITNEFLYSGHLQSLGAASIVYVTTVILKIPFALAPIISAYLLFQIIYWHDRLRDLKKDRATNAIRTLHIQSFASSLPYIAVLFAILLTVLLLTTANAVTISFSAGILILGILYPTYIKPLTKHIFLFKDLYVASVFGLMVLFPILYNDFDFTKIVTPMIAFTIFVFLKSMFMQAFLDIKDLKSDQAAHLRTLAALIGETHTLRVLLWYSIIITALFTALFILMSGGSFLPIIFLITIPFHWYILRLIQRQNYRAYILESGEFLLWTPLILLGTYIL